MRVHAGDTIKVEDIGTLELWERSKRPTAKEMCWQSFSSRRERLRQLYRL